MSISTSSINSSLAKAPIGIFDSGIGGMTVAHAIHELLPNEKIRYFGDTAHLPYGDKSKESITQYSKRITEFLLEKGAKVIVIACNSASAAAYEEVKNVAGSRALVLNVIDPVVDYINLNYNNTTIGLIGTKQTVLSGAYEKRIVNLNKGITVKSLATPLLVPVIEEGFCNTTISNEAVREYLSRETLSGIQSLILGCTHYPLLKKEIEDYYKSQLDVLDSANIVAEALKQILIANNLEAKNEDANLDKAHHFYVSDYTAAFEESTRIFFGEKIRLEHVQIW